MQPTTSMPFSAEQMKWYEQACARLDARRLQDLLFAITDIHSPTGSARAVGEFMTAHLKQIGMPARY